MRVLAVTWGPGGNLPPVLGAAGALAGRGHAVTVLGSRETRGAAERLGFPATGFRRAPEPDVTVAFEAQADRVLATAAGTEIAFDTSDTIAAVRPDLAVIDCMLPAALAAAEAAGTPAASIVHFLHGPARRAMLAGNGGGMTDSEALADTRGALALAPLRDGLAAWERCALVLVTAPRWLDVDAGAPPNVVHAGPLGIRPGSRLAGGDRVLLTFSTTVMHGQLALIERACAAAARLGVPATLTLGPAVRGDAVRVPPDVEVQSLGDHDRLLRGCAAVISHGGLGTVLRALAHGVPMIILPLGRDQGFNAGRVESLGAGIALPADAPEARIRAGLRRLLGEPSFRAAARAAAARIAADAPDRAAAVALERAVSR